MGVGTGVKVADDKIIQRQGERHQRAGNDTGHDLGQHHLEKRLERVAPQIQRRFVHMRVHLTQLGADLQHHIRQTKGDMRQQQCEKAGFQQPGGAEHKYEHQHQRHAGHDLRVDHRQIVDCHKHMAQPFVHAVHSHRRGGADDGGDRCRQHRDQQRDPQRFQNQLVVEQILVPPQREAFPFHTAFAIVEGKDDQQHDGGIQKQKNQRVVDTGQHFHIVIPPISSVSLSTSRITAMHSSISTISTSDSAAPTL